MSSPAVVARLAPRSDAMAVAAGFEEEGVPCRIELVAGEALTLAREAAAASPLGIGMGADAERLVLVLAAAPGRPYLEAAPRDARRLAQQAARLACRRPLAPTARRLGVTLAAMSTKTPQVEAYWSAFRAAAGLDHDRYEVVAFGDSATMADELAELVLRGPKRATAGLLRDFGAGGEPMPVVGDFVVVVDGQGAPRCIWRTTEVTVKPLIEVDDAFAWDEGEGDRTRDDWLDGHRRFFTRQAARQGFDFHDRSETVFERFTVVWPPEAADA